MDTRPVPLAEGGRYGTGGLPRGTDDGGIQVEGDGPNTKEGG